MSFGTGDHAELIVQPPSIDLGPDEADKEAVNQRRDSSESKKSEGSSVIFVHKIFYQYCVFIEALVVRNIHLN